MARITFVYPDFESLGVEYLMAACADAGHDVKFVYYEAEDMYLGKARSKPPYEQIADDICHTEPDIVAFSCVTDNYQHQLQCSRALKKQQKHIVTIFGGVHPTAVPEKTLLDGSVDAVAIGEAEHSLVDLLNTSEVSGTFSLPDDPIRGVIFKKYGATIGVPVEGKLADLDSVPFPYKQPFLSVLKDSIHEYRIMTSRGCPYHCSYCFNSYMRRLRGSKAIRRRSVDNVIAELLWAKKEFAVKRIMFVDDSFTTSKTWVIAFCVKYKAEIGLPFACIANPNYIDEETTGVLSSAGCVNVQLGIQSLSESICAQVLDR
ncbi:MAG: cobalamin-dependent protein, partial [Candidatus Poribacteria bacterium]